MDYGHNESKKMLERLEKDLGKLYGTAAAEVGEKFEKHMRDIAPKNRAKQVQLRIGKISEEEYNKWLLGQIAIGKRWNEMKQTLAEDFSNVHAIAEQMIGDCDKEVYALNFNYGTYEAEHGSGVNTSFTLYDKHTVERLIKENPDVLPTPKVGDPRWDKRKFQEGIAQGITQGESIPKVAKRVVLGTLEGDMKKAVRNARTATTSAQNGGRLNSYKRATDMGIKLKKTWMATDDSFTRQSHIDVDGETIPINETFSNECEYPGDPGGPPAEVWNCRCTMIADVDKASPSDKLPEGSFFDKPLTKESYEKWEKEHRKGENERKETDGTNVVNGKDISATWKRRLDQFDFEIEDVINAQGFDGLPQVVSADEFDKYVQESSFIAQRTYSAPDQDTLDAYREQLYNGKWYVDCFTGGAVYGQGMYCSANMEGNLSSDMKNEMQHYLRLNSEKLGGEPASDKTRFDIIDNYIKSRGLTGDEATATRAYIVTQSGLGKPSKEEIDLVKSALGRDGMRNLDTEIQVVKNAYDGARSYVETFTMTKDAKIVTYNELGELMNKAGLKGDYGIAATKLGYDGILAENSNYVVVLNRTKCIFKGV